VLQAAQLLESLGHHVTPARPSADIRTMMHAWTDIVAVGTALSIASATGGRAPRPDEIEGVGRGAFAYAATLPPTRYLQAVGQIHAFGRQMAGFFNDHDILLSATMAEPPARIGRFNHDTEDYLNYRIGPQGIFAYSPFCAVFNASGQPAASLPLGMSGEGLPIGIHLAAPFGDDATLIALCAEIEQAAPWAHRRAPLAVA
jgi:amidase